MELAAAAAVRAVDSGGSGGAFAAAAGTADPEGHAPDAEAAEEGGGSCLIREKSGLLKYRAPIDPQQRGKLESFDRKIGRAANALRVRSFVMACL